MNAAKFCGMIAVAVPLLYVLSIGPITAWYSRLHKIDMEEWHADNMKKADRAERFLKIVVPIYDPLTWINRRNRGFQQALEWYQYLWTSPDDQIVF